MIKYLWYPLNSISMHPMQKILFLWLWLKKNLSCWFMIIVLFFQFLPFQFLLSSSNPAVILKNRQRFLNNVVIFAEDITVRMFILMVFIIEKLLKNVVNNRVLVKLIVLSTLWLNHAVSKLYYVVINIVCWRIFQKMGNDHNILP